MERIKSYFQNSSLHGFHYIFESNRHWTERIFWTFMTFGAMIGCAILLHSTWCAFLNNSVSFTVETTYLGWETTFPAVSICEHDSPDKIYDFGNKLFGENRNMNLDFYLRDIAFFDGTCYSCKAHCNKTIMCMENMTYLGEQVRAPCHGLIGKCKWNGVEFDCCENFLRIETEIGSCFTINSLHTKRSNRLLKVNHVTGPGRLTFKAHEAIKVIIHAPEDVPYSNHPQEEKEVITWGHLFNITFQIKEIENDPKLKDVSITQRNCRFPEENILNSYSIYSYSACIVDCRIKAQIQFCGCVHHFSPTTAGAKLCDIQGLICLTNHSEKLRILRLHDGEKEGITCDCISSCTEPEYTVIEKVKAQNENYDDPDYGSVILVQMDSLPAQRFKRNVMRTYLDLVVSMGGAAGLFLGASLLTTCEFIYYIFIRKQNNNTTEKQIFMKINKNEFLNRRETLKHKLITVSMYQEKVSNQYSTKQAINHIPFSN